MNEEQLERKRTYNREWSRARRLANPELTRERDRIKNKARREKNREYMKAYQKARYAANRLKIRAQAKARYEGNLNGARDKALAYHREKYAKRLLVHRIQAAIRAAKTRAKQRGLSFDLSITDLGTPTHCSVTGIEFDVSSSFRGGNTFVPSLDRIDPSKGYVKENVRFVVHAYNLAKHTGPDSQVLKLARALVAKFGMEDV